MARPKAKIILSSPATNPKFEVKVIANENFQVVTNQGKPINVVKINKSQEHWNNPSRYIRTGFPSLAHATKLANKLNKLFKTTQFEVTKVL